MPSAAPPNDPATPPQGLEDLHSEVLSEPGAAAPIPAPAAEPTIWTPSSPDEPVAFVSDIHSNIEALTAVFDDIKQRGVKRIICLGDIVGYGPNPRECMDLLIERVDLSLMGNHDFAIFFEPYNFNTAAENAAFWTRAQFENDPDVERRNRRWKFLGSMPTRIVTERFSAFHGSPRRPINEYVFPDDIYSAPQKLAGIFDRFNHLCFVGHTHVPGVFVPDPDFYAPEELGGKFQLTPEKALINVGSVGQPRDRNPQASYVVLYPTYVEFLRVSYDYQTTANKVRAIDALDNFLGARLIDGR